MTSDIAVMTPPIATGPSTQFMWLELTGKCQLECVHCYAESGPKGTHGAMRAGDWQRVIDQGVAAGVRLVQFIGGEPTLHPDLVGLVDYALARRVAVEIYSNLMRVTPALWELFARSGVQLATSYYSTSSAQHDMITQRQGSHRKTRENIAEAIRRGIRLRVGIIGINEGQDVDAAKRDLEALGVQSEMIGIDYRRSVGRGVAEGAESIGQLCGNCANGVAAVMPDGTVHPCVFSRWLASGNVQSEDFAVIQASGLEAHREYLAASFSEIHAGTCSPVCNPINCQPHCVPMVPPCVPQNCQPMSGYCSPNDPGPRPRP